jgi:hypothetical protein
LLRLRPDFKPNSDPKLARPDLSRVVYLPKHFLTFYTKRTSLGRGLQVPKQEKPTWNIFGVIVCLRQKKFL